MKQEEFTIKSRHDKLELGVSLRIPEHPRGILQIVHGMAEHRERYYDFMNYCAKHNLIVMIHDHRGHGASAKIESDYGYFGKDGVNGLISDVYQITGYLRQRFPELPLTLFGHSMGSLIVRCYMQTHDADVDGLIVCGSPSKRLGAGAGKLLAEFLQIFRGERYRSNFINSLAFGNYSKKFPGSKSPNSWIVSDPAVVEAYDADSRDGFVFTLNGFATLFNLIKHTYRKSGWQMQNPSAPIFFVAGADDPCIISAQDFAKAVNFMRTRGYRDVESKLYPRMRHEILNEIGKEEVWADVVHWTYQKVLKSIV